MLQLRIGERNGFLGMPGIAKLSGQHQLNGFVLGERLRCIARHIGRLVVRLGIAIGVHLTLIAAFGELAAKREQLPVGGNGRFRVVLLALYVRQPVQENGTVVLLASV